MYNVSNEFDKYVEYIINIYNRFEVKKVSKVVKKINLSINERFNIMKRFTAVFFGYKFKYIIIDTHYTPKITKY